MSQGWRKRLAALVDSLDKLIYALLFVIGLGGLAYVAYVFLVG